MSLSLFVRSLMALGVRLEAEGENLRCRAPKGVLNAELRARLGEEKPAILEALTDRKRARAVWSDALQEVAAAWRLLRIEWSHEPPACEERAEELEHQIGEALRAADLARTVSLVSRWRELWLEVIRESGIRGAIDHDGDTDGISATHAAARYPTPFQRSVRAAIQILGGEILDINLSRLDLDEPHSLEANRKRIQQYPRPTRRT